jgi:hypothetical protein
MSRAEKCVQAPTLIAHSSYSGKRVADARLAACIVFALSLAEECAGDDRDLQQADGHEHDGVNDVTHGDSPDGSADFKAPRMPAA